MQTKKQSFLESLTNTAVGFIISLASTFVIFPLVGYESTPFKNLVVTVFFTVISIIRGYVIRRWFNKKLFLDAPLTIDFIEKLGFKKIYRLEEEKFRYDQFVNNDINAITIYFNYFADKKPTYDVEIAGWELTKISKGDLLKLIDILKR